MRNVIINGKSLDKCLKELQEYKKPDDYLTDKKFPYYKIESYYKRINAIFSLANYNVTYPFVTGIGTISSEQQFLTVKCHLEIMNDNGEVVLVREGLASKEITYNDAGREVNLKNLYRSTSQLAFKAAWEHLNIFGKTYDDADLELSEGAPKPADTKETSHTSSNKKAESSPNNAQNTSMGQTEKTSDSNPMFEVFTISPVQIEKEQRGKPVYYLLGELKDKQKVKVIFYPNQYGKNEQAMNNLIEKSKNHNFNYRFKGSTSGERDGFLQIVFKGIN